MSDGTINLPKRATPPSAPTVGRHRIYVDRSDNVAKYIDDTGTIRSFKGDQGDQGIQGPQGPTGPQGPAGPQGPMTVEAFISEKSTVTLPNSTSQQLIYSDSVTISSAGNCFLDVSLAYKGYSTSNDMEFKLEFGGTDLTPELIEEPKEIGSAQENWRSQCLDLGFVTAGTYTLNLFFSKESTVGTAQLKNYTAKVVRYS